MFLFARVFGLYYYFAVFRKGVFLWESAVLLIFGMLVRDRSKNCQYLIYNVIILFLCG